MKRAIHILFWVSIIVATMVILLRRNNLSSGNASEPLPDAAPQIRR